MKSQNILMLEVMLTKEAICSPISGSDSGKEGEIEGTHFPFLWGTHKRPLLGAFY